MTRAEKLALCRKWIKEHYPSVDAEIVERLSEYGQADEEYMHKALLITETGFSLEFFGERKTVIQARCSECQKVYGLNRLAWAFRHSWTHSRRKSNG